MIKTYCDICGKQINMKDDGVSLNFHVENIYLINQFNNEDKQLCQDCAEKVKAFIRNSAENK